jgi:hypothetical protein
VHYTALHELLKRNNCVKYWPLFLKESITIHNLGDLSPGELKQVSRQMPSHGSTAMHKLRIGRLVWHGATENGS